MRNGILIKLNIFLILVIFLGCDRTKQETKDTLFTSLPSSYTGIDFENKLTYDKDLNIYTYRNFYNGGGVAIGDVNNDGLPDIFFTANMLANRLYINKGNFQFEDVTEKAGIVKKSKWSTGVSMTDVNGDGLLDIYVCNSGNEKGENKENELYINNGPSANGSVSFTEKAKEYGLADKGYSTHASFFDYDRDGDLDMYLLNNSFRPIGSFNLKNNERLVRDSLGGDKLYRNEGNHFIDVSNEAGIYGSIIGFGLGVVAGDINKDGWPDIYVCNDHFERDYLYINNKNGTFTEDLENQMHSISNASMGADMSDINNDNLPDIFTTEMFPSTDARIKTNATFENWDKYKFNLQHGYYHQFTRNALQLNNGPSPSPLGESRGEVTFSEISRVANVAATDWSWGALIADLNNDGWKDIFVANGIYQDITNQDYIQYLSSPEVAGKMMNNKEPDYKTLIELIPSNPISNYAFINGGNLNFTNESKALGLDAPGFSNGSAYGDLDNDGDLDLVVNNVNMPCFVYRNETTTKHPENKHLRIKLVGSNKNSFALGTKVNVYCGDKNFYQEQMPTRGYQSTVDNRILFGLGKIEKIDSLIAEWPDGKKSILRNIQPDQEITLKQNDAELNSQQATGNKQLAMFTLRADNFGIDFIHKENEFIDFDRDPLIFHMLSREGPAIAKTDINGDGLEDIYIGGAKDQTGALYIQTATGNFQQINNSVFKEDKGSEDVAALFFDADNDGDKDLYVCSGGNEFGPNDPALKDRLYHNNGKGTFSRSLIPLPLSVNSNSSCVTAADFDADGDLDLFVGQRLKPLSYGLPVNGCLLQNDGKGKFTDVTKELAPTLLNMGMVTTAEWIDYDNDKKQDLVIAGEYMPVMLFHNEGGKLKNVSNQAGFAKTNGWWNRLLIADVNEDGYPDIIAGNHGLNSRFKASVQKPVSMYVNDFDENGTIEQIICQYNADISYPMVLRHDLVALLPALKGKYLKYDRYKEQTVKDIFSKQELKKALKLEAYIMETSVFINNKNGSFTQKSLPIEAQFSPVFGIACDDYDGDGKKDIVLGGNFYEAKPEVGIYDASYGLLLKGDGKGNFAALSPEKSGIIVKGEVRNIAAINSKKKKLIFLLNDKRPVVFGK
jgi:hypothetical protein